MPDKIGALANFGVGGLKKQWMPMWVEDQVRGLTPGFYPGAEYDYWNALAGGVRREGMMNGHLFSRVDEVDPLTGQPNAKAGLLLKSPKHPTFWKTLAGERDAGHEVFVGPEDRLYSKPKVKMGDVRGAIGPEVQFFQTDRGKSTPAYAADDGAVVFNPYSTLDDQQRESLLANERARLLMRNELIPPPQYGLTDAQRKAFSGYSADPNDIRQTIAARQAAGDPSAGELTDEQAAYAEQLKKRLAEHFGAGRGGLR